MSDDSTDHGLSLNGQGHSHAPPSDVRPEPQHDQESLYDTTRGSTNGEDPDRTRFQPGRLKTYSFPIDFGDYRLVRKIGEGGMGIVYEAEQKSLGNRRLALKTIKYVGDANDRALKRFKNEVEAVAQFEHRHIVPVYHLGEESGIHYYVMKLIEGKNLREFIGALKAAVSRGHHSTARTEHTKKSLSDHGESTNKSGWSKGDTLASNDVLDGVSREGSTAHPQFVRSFVRMGIQVANALHHIHQQGVVHRDIKPANLILDVDGDVWLTDFGLAQVRDSPSLTAPGDLIGTYHYMSPEQAMGSKRVIVDHRSDIYSLGVTLYELLTLRRAFPGGSREEILRSVQFDSPLAIRKLSPRIPEDLETIIMKAMAKDPGVRFQSAAEMASELRLFLDGKPLTIRPQSVLDKFAYWARNNRQTVASLAAVCLVTFVAAVTTAGVAVRKNGQTTAALKRETKEKERGTQLLQISEGRRLATNSLLQVETDPTVGMLLGVESAKRHPGVDANDAIMRGMDLGHEAKILKGHIVPPGHVTFNHEGTKLVSSATTSTFGQVKKEGDEETELVEPAIVWDRDTGTALGKLTGKNVRTITSAAFSPDDALILSASSPDEAVATNDLKVSPDDPSAVISADPPSLWDATTYRKLVTFEEAFLFKAHPRSFSPDGLKVVLPIQGNKAAVFFCAGTKLVELINHEARVVFAAFNLQGDRIVTYSDDNTVRIWNAESGAEILKFDNWRTPGLEKQLRESVWVEFSSDGRRLVTASAKQGILLFDLEKNGEPINSERVPGQFGTLYGNGDLLATYFGDDPYALHIRNAYNATLIGNLKTNQILRKVVISPDNLVAGVLHYDYLPRFQLWDLERRELRATLGGESMNINDLVFSPDSKLIATVSTDKNVRLWYVSNGRERATYSTAARIGTPVAATSPDGTIFAAATTDPEPLAAICDFAESKRTVNLNAEFSIPSSGGTRFLATSKGRLAIHAMDDGRFLGQEAFVQGEATETAISRDGDHVAAYVWGTTDVMLWMPDTNLRILLPVGTSQLNKLLFSPDGKRLFAISADGKIRIWDAESGGLIVAVDNGGWLYDIIFSPDAKQFAVTTLHNEATLYDADSLQEVRRFSDPTAEFTKLRFSFDGKLLLTYRPIDSKSVVAWDVDSGTISANLPIAGNVGVATHPTQPEAIVWSEQEDAVIWRYDENERLPVTDVRIRSGAYSSDGQHFYLATWAPAVWDESRMEEWANNIESPKIMRWIRDGLQVQETIDFPLEAIHNILVNDQDQVFVNAKRFHRVVNFDVPSHEPISTIPGHYAAISNCLFTSDSKRLITTSWDAHVTIWSVADGKLLTTRNDHHSPILAAAISRDDKYLVTGARDGKCLVWNLVDDTVSELLALSESAISHLQFDRDANRVLAISSDNKPHLFERATGRVVPLDFHTESIKWAELSPDGKSILVIPRSDDEQNPSKEVLIVPVDGSTVTKHEYESPVKTSHFHPESTRILTTTADGTVSIKNARSGATEKTLQHDTGFTQDAVFDPTGEYVSVSEFNRATIWRITDPQPLRWLTVEDRSVDNDWLHRKVNPFTSGKSRRIITQRFDTNEYRDVPLDPLQDAKDRLPRSLTEAERRRFYIED